MDNATVVRTFSNCSHAPARFPQDPMALALNAGLLLVEPGHAVLEFEPGAHFLQGAGVVQGGAVCAMLDFAAACAAMSVVSVDVGVVAVNLNTSFVRPAHLGRFTASAQVRKHGRSTIFVDAEINDASAGKLIATAQVVLHIVGR